MFHIIPNDCIKHIIEFIQYDLEKKLNYKKYNTLLSALLCNKLIYKNCNIAINNNIPICNYKSNNAQCKNICYKYQPIYNLKNKLIFKKHNFCELHSGTCEWIHKNGTHCRERAIYNYRNISNLTAKFYAYNCYLCPITHGYGYCSKHWK